VHRVLDARLLLVLHLGLGRRPDLDDRDATDQLGEPLLQLLTVVTRTSCPRCGCQGQKARSVVERYTSCVMVVSEPPREHWLSLRSRRSVRPTGVSPLSCGEDAVLPRQPGQRFLSLLRVWRGWRRAHVSEVARGGVAGSTPFSTRHHRRPAVSGEQGGRTDDDYADHSRTQLDSSIEEITIPPAYLWDRLKVVAPLGRRHKIGEYEVLLEPLWKGTTVRVTDVGFFDVNHLQVGRSRSCIELHPILTIERMSEYCRNGLPAPVLFIVTTCPFIEIDSSQSCRPRRSDQFLRSPSRRPGAASSCHTVGVWTPPQGPTT
jgi:hypothetical protein